MDFHFYNCFQDFNKAVILPTFFSFCCLMAMISPSKPLADFGQLTQKRKRTKNRLHKRNLHLTTNNSPRICTLELLPKEILYSILHKLFDSFVQTFLWTGIFCEGFIHAHVYSCINTVVYETTSGFSYGCRELLESPYWYTEDREIEDYNVDPKFVKQTTESFYGGLRTQICRSCKCEDLRHFHGQCKSCDHIKLLTNCLHDLKGNCKCDKCLFSANIARGYKKPDFYCRCVEEWQ